MKYIFGIIKHNGVDIENLKTISNDNTELSGFVEIKQNYTDSIIIDHFNIDEKYDSFNDPVSGEYYNWYRINNHYRYVDYSPKHTLEALNLKNQLAQADETAIELYESHLAQEEINAGQDDALIELYELIGGE